MPQQFTGVKKKKIWKGIEIFWIFLEEKVLLSCCHQHLELCSFPFISVLLK